MAEKQCKCNAAPDNSRKLLNDTAASRSWMFQDDHHCSAQPVPHSHSSNLAGAARAGIVKFVNTRLGVAKVMECKSSL
jgi:hypothetical protein